VIDISVILPVYNASEYLSEAIESILNQSFQNFELLIINDGSTDKSKEIINSFSDTRIKYIDNNGNKGLIYTLNRGIEESKGTYIARMDADDISLSNRFVMQFDYMEQHPQVGACGTYAQYIGDRQGFWKYPIDDTDIRCRLMWGSSIIHPTAFIRTSILKTHHIKFSEDYIAAEDYKIWVDISRVAQLHNIPDVLLKYRTHSHQVTTTKGSAMDYTKTKIIFENIVSTGVNLLETDFDILLKFITYKYNFQFAELNRLIEIYGLFIKKNNVLQICNPLNINQQIKERIFEACYFSTKYCGLNAVKIFKQNFSLNDINVSKQLKFYYKAIAK
jgi:glycosyltransferase involved in cell wall biosynthesis